MVAPTSSATAAAALTALAAFAAFAAATPTPFDATTALNDRDARLRNAPVVMTHLIFRHGDRTPDVEEMELYPENPYKGNTFYPFGLKALTNAGKLRLYRLGRQLRGEYDDLLSRTYIPTQISVRTTDYDRTKMSALVMLAGLYPPDGVQEWNEDLLWQPIPYNTIPYENDDMMYYYLCDRYNQARLEELYKPSFQKRLQPYHSLFEKLNILTGRNITTPEEIFYLDNLFQAEISYGLKIPKWAIQLMPKIQEMTKIEYDLEFYTAEMMRLAGGVAAKEIVDNMISYANGTLDPPERKMVVYSAHENNVAAMLACLGVFQPHQPTYGSTAIIELRKNKHDGRHLVTILYIRHVGMDPEPLFVPRCESPCPLEKLVELIEPCLSTKEQHDAECVAQPRE